VCECVCDVCVCVCVCVCVLAGLTGKEDPVLVNALVEAIHAASDKMLAAKAAA
jgi:hypothetical protein